MNIPEAILEPFGYTGIPFLRPVMNLETVEATMTRLFGHLKGLSDKDMRDSLECAVLILGANTAVCKSYQYVIAGDEDDVGVMFVLRFILYGSEDTHVVRFADD